MFSGIKGNPIFLVITLGIATGGLVYGYKFHLQPYFDRQSRLKARKLADFLFENETKDGHE